MVEEEGSVDRVPRWALSRVLDSVVNLSLEDLYDLILRLVWFNDSMQSAGNVDSWLYDVEYLLTETVEPNTNPLSQSANPFNRIPSLL